METDMRTTFPIVPIAAAAPMRAFASISAVVTGWLKALARARMNRAQARALAGLEGRMLSDIGITRADLRDAFSEPFWEDPTALLRERALERRLNRQVASIAIATGLRAVPAAKPQDAFRRPPLDRPARQTI
jgi:uncharacterized protein YjiS (DUF1127 family)